MAEKVFSDPKNPIFYMMTLQLSKTVHNTTVWSFFRDA